MRFSLRMLTKMADTVTARELQVPAPFGVIRGKEWGNPNGAPVLGLHGWLDNAGTFDHLAPLLPLDKFHFVSLDVPGFGRSSHMPASVMMSHTENIPPLFDGPKCHIEAHRTQRSVHTPEFPSRPPSGAGFGRSSHMPAGVMMSHADNVTSIQRVVRHLNWSRYSVIGHSMGASIGVLIAAAFPKQVDKFIMLDWLKPISSTSDAYPKRLSMAVNAQLKAEEKLERGAPTSTLAELRARQVAMDIMLPRSVDALLRRGSCRRTADERINGEQNAPKLAEKSSDGEKLERNRESGAEKNADIREKLAEKNVDREDETAGDFLLSRDLRAQLTPPYMYSHEQMFGCLSLIKCKVLFVRASDGLLSTRKDDPLYAVMDGFGAYAGEEVDRKVLDLLRSSASQFEQVDVQGRHHVHLDHPDRVAPAINRFLLDAKL